MNGAVLLAGALIFYVIAYFVYGRFLSRVFGVDSSKPTPAHTKRDGVDFVPTKPFVLFGHHFASIAGGGPVVGPILAIYFGWAPVVAWILIGSVFAGAMHDFAALMISVKNGGRSIASIIEDYIGYFGRQLFLLFCWATIVLVVSVFASMVAGSFIQSPAVATSSMLFIAIAPVFGWLVYRKGFSLIKLSFLFVPLVFFFVWLGLKIPFDLGAVLGIADAAQVKSIWIVLLLLYGAAASVLPVWTLLQPRDYLSSYLLYAMLILGIVGVAVFRPELQLPAFMGYNALPFDGTGAKSMFPFLFIIVACGACSGFHSLIASGTTSKQLDNEKDALPIGYCGMLVEGIIAIVAIVSVAYLSRDTVAESFAAGVPAPVMFANGVSQFGAKIGLPPELGASFVVLAMSAFFLTTLDTATRLARFCFQELLAPRNAAPNAECGVRSAELGDATSHSTLHTPHSATLRAFFSNAFVATFVSVVLSAVLAFGAGGKVWPVFGATNQLLSALTLLVVTLWLIRRKRKPLIAFIPMVFMLAVSGTGLFLQGVDALFGTTRNFVIGVPCMVLLGLSLALVALSVCSVFKEFSVNKRVAGKGRSQS